ncbi:MAG: hypothetical protein HC842_09045, partial [Cytophagales bacterium]|nr:hypothetical protein [Cytophagales bacterium]
MKNSLLLMFLILLVGRELGAQQSQVSFHFDIEEKLIDPYLEGYYTPEQMLETSYVIGQRYSTGKYYDKQGKLHRGEILYNQTNTVFRFRKDEKDKPKIIDPEECSGYVIGYDSFAVVTDIEVQRKLFVDRLKNPEFVQVLASFGNMTFYEHMHGERSVVATRLLKLDESTQMISFSKKDNKFKEQALPVFSSIPYLNQKIESGEWDEKDILQMIKMLEYKYRLDRNEKLYFRLSWEETRDSASAKYIGQVMSLNDTIWTIKYSHKNGSPIYQGSYSRLYPHRKNGEFLWFDQAGKVRKRVSYQNDKIVGDVIIYHASGTIHMRYRWVGNKPFFAEVNDTNGKPLLNAVGFGTEVYKDQILNRDVTRTYGSRRITSAFYLDDKGNKIYQYAAAPVKAKSWSKLKKDYKGYHIYPKNARASLSEGMVLAKVIVDPKGRNVSSTILKSAGDQLDQDALAHLHSLSAKRKWVPAKENSQKVYAEVVIP